MIAIIDYGSGNIQSIKNALDYLKVESTITSDPKIIESADKIIFPGVGSFGYMMDQLNKKQLIKPIKQSIAAQKPFLGICLGLQALFEESEESTNVKGLAIFKGKVKKFTKGKIPQIGWNTITPQNTNNNNNNIFSKGYTYFVNSYYVIPEDKSIIATKTNYFGNFTSAIQYKNITATQFHPEKSGEFGLKLLRSWLKC
tara:strand:- start:7776 stop:8372 length:597 start_codon:yes stop_codon:yes gene_type:complete